MSKQINVVEIVSKIQDEIKNEVCNINHYYRDFFYSLKESGKIVIVGAGVWGNDLYKQLQKNDIDTVKCYADNSAQQYPYGLCGKSVLSIEDAIKEYMDADFIVTPYQYRMTLVRQLVNNGVDINHVYVYEAEKMGLII